MRAQIKKILVLAAAGLFIFSPVAADKAGKHNGENKQLEINIEFTDAFGSTVTDTSGTYYYYQNYLIGYENKIYPEQYQGEFPLYFFNHPVGITVTITNKGPRNRFKLKVLTESYVLKTDGSNGTELFPGGEFAVDLKKGETKEINASFTAWYQPGIDSGLDRFLVKVLHVNSGGGPGNELPALITQKEGIFCPPEFVP